MALKETSADMLIKQDVLPTAECNCPPEDEQCKCEEVKVMTMTAFSEAKESISQKAKELSSKKYLSPECILKATMVISIAGAIWILAKK